MSLGDDGRVINQIDPATVRVKAEDTQRIIDNINTIVQASNSSGGYGSGLIGTPITPSPYTYPPFTTTDPVITYDDLSTEEVIDSVFDSIRELLEDMATERKFSDELYDRWLSAKILLADLLAEVQLAETRLELIGGLLNDFRETAEIVGSRTSRATVDGELSEELASPQASEAGQDLA